MKHGGLTQRQQTCGIVLPSCRDQPGQSQSQLSTAGAKLCRPTDRPTDRQDAKSLKSLPSSHSEGSKILPGSAGPLYPHVSPLPFHTPAPFFFFFSGFKQLPICAGSMPIVWFLHVSFRFGPKTTKQNKKTLMKKIGCKY